MSVIFCSIKITRSIRPSVPKLFVVRYSSATKAGVKESSTGRQRCASYPNTFRQPSLSSSLIPSGDPRTAAGVAQTANEGKSLSRKEPSLEDDREWRCIKLDPRNVRKHCFMLSKVRLTSLVVATTMAGYVLAPGPFDPSVFLACSLGTGLFSATANAINQFLEVPFDAQMSRTKNRVLVRGHLTPGHAVTFAAVSGIGGLLLLYNHVNGLTAALGLTNMLLYTLVYTPMKRVSILNTWVGSIVGAIPPLMGWAACTGDVSSPGAWIMPGLLYAWQFPHFNALSWNLRPDYSRAGYRMMAVTNPKLCRKTALRYTAALTGLCYLAPISNATTWWFALTSTPLNAYFLYLAWKFHKRSDSRSSRELFHFSLIHLPALMVLMLVNKQRCDEKKGKSASASASEEKRNNVLAALTKAIAWVSTSSTAQ